MVLVHISDIESLEVDRLDLNSYNKIFDVLKRWFY